MSTTNEENWSLIIHSKHKLLDLKLREVIRYRDLVFLFVKRDFAVQYKQTVLGPLWYVIQPLISTIMYAFVFGNLAQIGTDGIPYLLFYYGGTMLWNYFTGSLNNCSAVFLSNAGLFGKVYFPRLTVPISLVIGQMIKAGIQFVLLMAFYFYYLVTGEAVHPTWYILLFPVIMIWIGVLGSGIGLFVSALATKYRDLKLIMDYGISLAMYVTPVVYPLSQAPKGFMWLFYLNPMSAPMELFRMGFYGAGHVPLNMVLCSVAITLLVFFFGLVLFCRNERTFVDTI